MTSNGSGNQYSKMTQRSKWNSPISEWVVDSGLSLDNTTKTTVKTKRSREIKGNILEGWVNTGSMRPKSHHCVGYTILVKLISMAFYFCVLLAIVFFLKCKGAPAFFNNVRQNMELVQDAVTKIPMYEKGKASLGQIPTYPWIAGIIETTSDKLYKSIVFVHEVYLVKKQFNEY